MRTALVLRTCSDVSAKPPFPDFGQVSCAVDNIVGYELVKPDGTVAQITAKTDPELAFGLKGGLNNFVSLFDLLYVRH